MAPPPGYLTEPLACRTTKWGTVPDARVRCLSDAVSQKYEVTAACKLMPEWSKG